ncbi:hypothetical protein FRC04_005668 [Tulasnella sp. 424]|nr:hypothetical protein FRC04_005668 [Tulasnella sp. 424]KAG8961800.1 hypothetical protein FRC05_005782 [Tulasnella sp. 425]
MAAPDGTSYLQFWDEASRCWAENSAARPRIIDVLSRLDRQRAESLVTSQQLMLEDSLVLPMEGLAISQSYSGLGSSLPDVSATEIRDSLDWAYSIRSRMTTLVNSRQPISRVPPGIIARIIMVEAAKSSHGQGRVTFTQEWQPNFKSLNELYIARIIRFAELRVVCKQWRDAIDGTPEFTQCILVGGGMNNIEYVLRYNHDSPLELFIDSSTPTELQSVLESLACRLSSAYLTDMIAPAPFPILQAVRISGTRVPDTFVTDLLEMLRVCPNVEELILDSLTSESLSNEGSPGPRPDHSGLQRVRITRLPPSLQMGVLQSLGLKGHATLIVDQMHPGYLWSPDSAIGNIIRSLGQMESSSVHTGLLEVGGIRNTYTYNLPKDRGCLIAFMWSASGRNPPDERSGKGAEASWASCRLESGPLTNGEALEMIRVLVDSGIAIKTADLFSHLSTDASSSFLYNANFLSGTPQEINSPFHWLPRVNKLILGGAAVYPSFRRLKVPISVGSDRDDMFLCPHLTQLELLSSPSKDVVLNYIWELVTERQKERPKTMNPAKLERVGLPFRDDRFSDPAFEGIEFYLVN